MYRRIVEDLADGLLDSCLGEVTGEDGVLVRAHHRGLEPHRERELGDHDTQKREDERHREERETALVGRDRARPHGAVTRTGTVMGDCS
jgi:hypothetical protein